MRFTSIRTGDGRNHFSYFVFKSFYNMSALKRPNSNSGVSNGISKKMKGNHWSAGLLASMEDPNFIVESDRFVVVIKDKHPKAEFHYLILPRENISSLKMVKPDNLDLLKHMHQVAEKLVQDSKHEDRNFLIGYHAQPSMTRLHLHVLSDDMNSPHLKTKQHYNSFTTKFFFSSKDVCSSLESEGVIKFLSQAECQQLVKKTLQCHKCRYEPRNVPDLKTHLLTHLNIKDK